jgi:antitoxin (DNA-binding transcriptional repressor) of toxin-antitoxin stability system
MTEPIRRWKAGDRVTLTVHGRVEFDRSGFVRVQWDDREPSSEWGADLVPEPPADSNREAA